ncbi:hypothetical protein L1049_003696 [Liquidambar formosana]|uniref:Uncharacterized protein n=1 Tax=Liquidambar formosana TaxID=63359 RepID=A0AAP0WVC5_LIQFO
MEIEGEDGSRIQLKKGSNTEFGRGLGLRTNDQTVSRHHVLFKLDIDKNQTDPESETRAWFQVIGKNPVWVLSSRSGEIRVFRRCEKGEMEVGDRLCVSGKNPVWFALKRNEFEEELAESLQTSTSSRSSNGGFATGEDMEFECIDASDIDPVKEFGFLVMGHEFDRYPNQMIHDIKKWDWFLEEPRKDSEDDNVLEKNQKRGLRRKRKKDEAIDDDDWTGESEDDKEPIAKLGKVQKPKYSTRSKDCNKPLKGTSSKDSVQKRTIYANNEYDENEDDDTLGGFIVDNDEVEQKEESDEDEEEEEEDYEEEDDDEEIDD